MREERMSFNFESSLVKPPGQARSRSRAQAQQQQQQQQRGGSGSGSVAGKAAATTATTAATPTTTTTPPTTAVDAAREAREARARARLQSASAVRIQAVVRGGLASRRARREVGAAWGKKARDARRVAEALGKGRAMALPAGVAAGMADAAAFVSLSRHSRKRAATPTPAPTPTPPSTDEEWSPEARDTVASMLAASVRGGTLALPGTSAQATRRFDGALATSAEAFAEPLLADDVPPQIRLAVARALVRPTNLARLLPPASAKDLKPCFAAALRACAALLEAQPFPPDPAAISALQQLMRSPRLFAPAPLGLDVSVVLSPLSTLRAVLVAMRTPAASLSDSDPAFDVHSLANLLHIIHCASTALVSPTTTPPMLFREVLETIAAQMRLAPAHVYLGAEGVMWTPKGVVSVSDPDTLRRIDLAAALTPLLPRALAVNDDVWRARVDADVAAWATVSEASLASEAMPTLSRPSFSFAKLLSDTFSASSWAARLGLGASTHVVAGSGAVAATSPSGPLPNVSATSRHLASSASAGPPPPSTATTRTTSTKDLFTDATAAATIAEIITTYFFRWPPTSTNPRSFSLLNSLAFAHPLTFERLARLMLTSSNEVLPPAVALVGSHLLLVTDEAELYEGRVLSRYALNELVKAMNARIFAAHRTPPDDATLAGFSLRRQARFLALLYDQHSRRPLARADAWLVKGADASRAVERYCIERIPWSVLFSTRARRLTEFLSAERERQQPQYEPAATKLRVRRRMLLEDAFEPLLRADLKKRVYVVFVNDFGVDEPGIDARGLFKEFLTLLAETVFDPARGLFSLTTDGDNALYPNPDAAAIHGAHEAARLFEFAGRVLGKAIYEGIVIQPVFSFYVLAKLLNKFVTISDLAALDKDLFRNLMFLKHMDGDARDLCLTFTVATRGAGVGAPSRVVELFPGGANVEVTNANKFRYIGMVSHHRLNVESKEAHAAFIRGVHAVLDPAWLAPFSEREVEILISGVRGGKIEVEDWKAHTVYAGGYVSATQQPVRWFWDVVERDMSDADRALLLRFVTSCSRAPLLGFSGLNPPFTIVRVAYDEPGKLPMSATCFNTLKLPAYPSRDVLKDRLLVAIRSGAGFDLT